MHECVKTIRYVDDEFMVVHDAAKANDGFGDVQIHFVAIYVRDAREINGFRDGHCANGLHYDATVDVNAEYLDAHCCYVLGAIDLHDDPNVVRWDVVSGDFHGSNAPPHVCAFLGLIQSAAALIPLSFFYPFTPFPLSLFRLPQPISYHALLPIWLVQCALFAISEVHVALHLICPRLPDGRYAPHSIVNSLLRPYVHA